MVSGFLILLREGLEACLFMGVILGFLVKIDQKRYVGHVLTGAAAGVGLSILVALLLGRFTGGLSERGEELFEGVTMLFAAFLVTTVLLWMRSQQNAASDLNRRVAEKAVAGRGAGLFFLSFFSIFREGIEAVVFLSAASYASERGTLLGASIGILAALLLGIFVFIGSLRIDFRKFFTVMGVMLILLAAGLVAQGIHELEEAGVLPGIVERVWNLNPEVATPGRYPLLHEKGAVGGLLKGIFGYNGDPSLLEVLGYVFYLGFAFTAWGRTRIVKRGANDRTSAGSVRGR